MSEEFHDPSIPTENITASQSCVGKFELLAIVTSPDYPHKVVPETEPVRWPTKDMGMKRDMKGEEGGDDGKGDSGKFPITTCWKDVD